MPTNPKPNLSYTARDYDTIRAQIEAFVQAARPEEWSNFYESNLGTLLLDIIALVGDQVSYGQDVAAQETFLATARRYDSALRAARSVGYLPRSAFGAQVTLRSVSVPSNVATYGGLIVAGSTVTGLNGLKYEVIEDLTVAPGTAVISVPVRQGQSHTQTYTPTRSAGQEVVTVKSIVENNSWSVYVGDTTNPDNKWSQVSNIARETSASKTYEIFFDGAGRLHVKFGDNNSGKIPDASVTIKYRTCDGELGNSLIGSVSGNLQVSIPALASTASVQFKNSDSPATGGQDRESVEELRQSIPAFVRTLDVIRSLSDYEDSLKTAVGVKLVYADVPLSSYQGNVVRVHLWDSEQYQFTSTSPTSGTSSTVVYERFVQTPFSRLFTVQQYLNPRTIASVHNVLVRPTVSNVDLYLGGISYDRALFSANDVHLAVVEAVVKVFESSNGFVIRLADIYDQVLNVAGVRHFTIQRVVWEHVDWSNPPGLITEDFRTDQDSAGLAGGPFLPLKDIEVPTAGRRKYYDDSYLYENEISYTGSIDNPNVQAINLRSLTFDLRN